MSAFFRRSYIRSSNLQSEMIMSDNGDDVYDVSNDEIDEDEGRLHRNVRSSVHRVVRSPVASYASQIDAVSEENRPPEFTAQSLIAKFRSIEQGVPSTVVIRKDLPTTIRSIVMPIPNSEEIMSTMDSETEQKQDISEKVIAHQNGEHANGNSYQDNKNKNAKEFTNGSQENGNEYQSGRHGKGNEFRKGVQVTRSEYDNDKHKKEDLCEYLNKRNESNDITRSLEENDMDENEKICTPLTFKLRLQQWNKKLESVDAVRIRNHSQELNLDDVDRRPICSQQQDLVIEPVVHISDKLMTPATSKECIEPRTGLSGSDDGQVETEAELPEAGFVKNMLRLWNQELIVRQTQEPLLPKSACLQKRNRASWASERADTDTTDLDMSSSQTNFQPDLTHGIKCVQSESSNRLIKSKNDQLNSPFTSRDKNYLPNENVSDCTSNGKKVADCRSERQRLPWSGMTRNVREKFEKIDNHSSCSSSQKSATLKSDVQQKRFRWTVKETTPLSRPIGGK